MSYELNPTFKYKFKLNGEELRNVALGVAQTEKAEESFDEVGFNIPITVKDIEYEMLGFLEIHGKDGKGNQEHFYFLIISDSVSLSGRYGFYDHSLRAVEYTEKLNQYFVDTFVNTLPNLEGLNKSAQFEVDYSSDLMSYIGPGSRRRVKDIPIIDFKDTYYEGEITFEQVSQIYWRFSEGYSMLDAYLQLDDGTKQNISQGNVTFNLTAGRHTIRYGLLDVPESTTPGGDLPMYIFYINVIDKYQFTLYDVVQRLRNIKPFETQAYHGTTRIFDIDNTVVVNGYTLEDVLKATPAPQFFIQQTTMFQALSGIFKYINSIPRLLPTNFSDNDKLSRDDFNEIVAQISPKGIYDYDSNQDTQLYATRGVSPLQRTLPTNLDKPNIETPANNFFKTVRAVDVQLTENDGKFVLPLSKGNNIYKLTKVEFLLPEIELERTGVFPSPPIKLTNLVVDITDVFLNKIEWELLDNVNLWEHNPKRLFGQYVGLISRKTDALFWEQGQDYIDVSKTFQTMITEELQLKVVLQTAINKLFTYKMINELPFFIEDEEEYALNLLSYTLPDFNDIKFNVEYITLQDFNVVQNREDNHIINRYSEINLKQSDKQLNVELASRKSYGELQRGSLPNYTDSKIHYYFDEVLPLFSMDEEGYVITQRSIKFFNTHLDVSYYHTKDHNRLQEFIGVNQEYRPFEIPTSNKIYERKEFYNDIVYIKEHNDTITTTRNLMTPLSYLNMTRNLKNDLSKKKITYAIYYTPEKPNYLGSVGSETEFILLPVNVVGAKQTIMISMGFNDNQIAGDMIEIINANDIPIKYNKAVRYTNEIGRVDEMWFALFSDIEDIVGDSEFTYFFDLENYNYENYPLFNTQHLLNLNNILLNSIINNGGIIGGDSINGTYNPFKVYKDSAESILIQYGISFKSWKYKQFIVGQSFTSNNPLVSNDLKELYLYKITNKKYGIFNDMKIIGYDTLPKVLLSEDNVILTTFSNGVGRHGIRVQFTGTSLSTISGGDGWAIGDIDGNLYLACNEMITDFDFVGTHLDPKVKEIGKNRNY